LIIDQSNRKYLTCAQKVTGRLFIARTGTELKGMTKNRKKTVAEQSWVRKAVRWVGWWRIFNVRQSYCARYS